MRWKLTAPVGRRERGFTLMELLVAMTLLGILLAASFGSLRLGARVWEASDRSLDDGNRNDVIRGFLKNRIEGALPMTAVLSGERAETLFLGERTGLRFASTMPISFGNDLFLLEFRLRPRAIAENTGDLVLTWRSLEPNATNGDLSTGERVLIDGIVDLDVGYFGRKRNQPLSSWSYDWQDEETLPDLIRIDLHFPKTDQRRWQTLIVSPMIDEWYDTAY